MTKKMWRNDRLHHLVTVTGVTQQMPTFAYMLKPAGPRRCAAEGITHIIYILEQSGNGFMILPTPATLMGELTRCDIRHNSFDQSGTTYVSVNVPHVGAWGENQCPGGFTEADNADAAMPQIAESLRFKPLEEKK